MANLDGEIDAALQGNEPLPREKVVLWIEAAANLRTLDKLYRLTDEGYYRIQPELGMEATCALIQRYLLECIRENVLDDDEILSRFEAAMTLHSWFRHLTQTEGTAPILRTAANAVTELYLASDENAQYTIETGFLEHALETAAVRPYFEHWASDERLREGWELSLQWAKDHPDGVSKPIRLIDENKEE